MRDFLIGDRVTFCRRAFYVRGFSPMSVTPPSIQLEDAETGDQLEVAIDDLKVERPGVQDSGRP